MHRRPEQQEGTIMKTAILTRVPAGLVVLGLLQAGLAAQGQPAQGQAGARQALTTIEAVKAKAEQLETRLQEVKDSLAGLKPDLEVWLGELKADVEKLDALRRSPDKLTDGFMRRVYLVDLGEETWQLQALKDVEKLGDEGVLLAGAAAKHSKHATVRRRALQAAVSLGPDGYPIVAYCFGSLPPEDRVHLVEQLAKQAEADSLLPFLAMAKEGDKELRRAILNAAPSIDDGLLLIAAIAEAGDKELTPDLINAAAKLHEDDGLLLLYAAAAHGETHHMTAALKAAAERKEDGVVVAAGAFDSQDPVVRAELVRTVKRLGGELAQSIIDHALQDPNEALRRAAEEALAEPQKQAP